MQVTDYGPVRTYPRPQDMPADLAFEHKRVSPERRVVEIHEPTPGRLDPSPREPRRSSRSGHRQPRELVLSPKSRRRRNSSESDSESDSDTNGSSPRRIRNRRNRDRYLPVAPAGPVRVNSPGRSRSVGAPRSRSRGPPGPPKRYDSSSESSSDDDDDHHHRKKKALPKPPPKQILYTGLACVATIAAANNIYQSAKAHHTRQRELEDGDISSAESQKLKAEARKMDLISLGVAAVGAYNVRNGWRRAEGHWKAHRERQAEGRR